VSETLGFCPRAHSATGEPMWRTGRHCGGVGARLSSSVPATSGTSFRSFYVTKLNPGGTTYLYNTFLGSGPGTGIAVDHSDEAIVVGQSFGIFSVHNATHGSNAGGMDAVFPKFTSADSTTVYATYMGGTGTDIAEAVATNLQVDAILVGSTARTRR
jgi:hypothetical protein